MSDVSTFLTPNFTRPGICAGCLKVLDVDYGGWVRGVALVDRGAVSIRVCNDARITGTRSTKMSCVKKLKGRLLTVKETHISIFPKAEIERVVDIHLRVVR